MNVSELYQLTKWISTEVEGKQILSKYKALHQVLQQHVQSQNRPSFEAQKDDLINAIRVVPLCQLTNDQLDFLENLGISDTLGREGVDRVEDVLYRNVIDVATSANKIQEISQFLNEGIVKSNKILSGLDGNVFDEGYESENEVLMRVVFAGDASFGNVIDFKKWGNVWFDIGRGIAMAHGTTPEEVKVVGATKGSIIIELAVIASIATTTSGIILAGLKVAEKVMDIRLKSEELKGLKLKNTKLSEDLAAEADKEKEIGIEEITKEFTEKLNISNDDEGDKIIALEKAIKHLVGFVEKGGVVDFVLPEANEEDEETIDRNNNMKLAFREIRLLEKKLNLIDYQKPDVS